MKQAIAIAVLALTVSFASAQKIGFHINRGMNTLCPDYSAFKSSLNTGVGFGLTNTKRVNKNLSFVTGINVTSLRSGLSVKDANGVDHLIPEKYNYVDVPFILEKRVNIARRGGMSKSAHLLVQAGINAAFLKHSNPNAEAGVSVDGRTTNYGLTLGTQWSKYVNWNSQFAIGPQVKIMSTGEDKTSTAIYAAIKMDWRFGK